MPNEFRNTLEAPSLLSALHVLEELMCRVHKGKLRKKDALKLLRFGWGLFSMDSPGLLHLGVGVLVWGFFSCGIAGGARG